MGVSQIRSHGICVSSSRMEPVSEALNSMLALQKFIWTRTSLENVSPIDLHLYHLSTCHPEPIFKYVLHKIRKYNLIKSCPFRPSSDHSPPSFIQILCLSYSSSHLVMIAFVFKYLVIWQHN